MNRSTRAVRASVSAACASLVWLAAGAARAEDADPWLGRDKAYHFAASSTIASGGYVAGALLFDARGHALIVGASLAAAAGIGKEVLDATGYGDPSWKDLAWDGIGMLTGLALAWAIDLAVRGVSPERPLFVKPVVTPPDGARAAWGASVGLRF